MNRRQTPRDVNRRDFLRAGFRGFSVFLGASVLHGCHDGTGGGSGTGQGPGGGGGSGSGGGSRSNIGNLGHLQPPDGNGVMLPVGFTSRIVAETGRRPTSSSSYAWHVAPDGGAVFPAPGDGWVYVSNSEVDGGGGGVGAILFDQDANVIDAYSILENTARNCAGGRTPWGTWLSCEEYGDGRVWECDPFGMQPAVSREAMGVFSHEAAAVDPVGQHVYLTEDEGAGGFYRFVPDRYPDLSSGTLEIAEVLGPGPEGQVVWHAVPDPAGGSSNPTRRQVSSSTGFDGGEGMGYFEDRVYFVTKGDDRVWCYDIPSATITILYDPSTSANPILQGVDNVEISVDGDVLVAEDGGDMQIVAITPSGLVLPVIELRGHEGSEITGPAFDPSLRRLYFSSQNNGQTFEVTGPFVV